MINNKKNFLYKNTRNFISLCILLFVIMFLLSGFVNQHKTGKTVLNYILNIGKQVSLEVNKIVDGKGKLKIIKDGIYFKNADVEKNDLLEGSFLDKEKVEQKEEE